MLVSFICVLLNVCAFANEPANIAQLETLNSVTMGLIPRIIFNSEMQNCIGIKVCRFLKTGLKNRFFFINSWNSKIGIFFLN